MRAVDFIKRNKDNLFFLYVAHSMPHVPLYVNERNENKTNKGIYADVIWEIDWSVGKIIESLKENGIDKNTLSSLQLIMALGSVMETTPDRQSH